MTDDRALNYTLRQPLGVAGLISPWNLPLYLLTWKIAPAIAAGNCCVAKPSELTPQTADRLAALTLEAGIPPRRRQHRARPRKQRRSRPHVASGRPPHLVHRGNEDGRRRDGLRGAALQESVAGVRRKEPEHRLRGRRSRAGRRHVDSVELRQPGGDLPLRIATVRREKHLRRIPRPLSGGYEKAPDRRPAGPLDRRGRARERASPSQGRRLRRARERGRWGDSRRRKASRESSGARPGRLLPGADGDRRPRLQPACHAGGDLRARRHRHALRFSRGGDRLRQRHAPAMDFRRASGPGTSRRPTESPRRSTAGRCGSTRGCCGIFAFPSAG